MTMLDSVKRADVFLRKPAPVAPELQHEIEQFYYWEAKLLNDRRFEEWFALLAADIHYFMPIRTTRIMRDARLEYSGTGENAHFDDDAAMMQGRLRKVTSDVGWSERSEARRVGTECVSPCRSRWALATSKKRNKHKAKLTQK